MTIMESLGMLGLSVQARAPTPDPGCGSTNGPPGTSTPLPGKRAAFADALRHLLFGTATPRAQHGAAPAEPAMMGKTEPTAPPEKGADGPQASRRPKAREGVRHTGEPVAVDPATVPVPMPLDLIEGAADGGMAPEPSGAGAETDMAVTAVDARGAPTAWAPSSAPDTPVEAVASEAPQEGSPRAAPDAASTAEGNAVPEHPSDEPGPTMPVTGGKAAGETATLASPVPEATQPAVGSDVATRFTQADADRSTGERPTVTGRPAEATTEATEDTSPHGRLAMPPHVAERRAAPASGALRGALPADGAGDPPADGQSPIQEARTPPPDATDAPGSDLAAPEAAPQRPRPLSQTAPAPRQAEAAQPPPQEGDRTEVERPGRRQLGVPADGAPETIPGSPQATAVHWLHGPERVDEGQALQQTQRVLIANLAEDIRRLTFVGEHRAVLQLQPPDLGKLSIHLTMQDGGLSVGMMVETEAVKAIVESTLDQLQTALAQHGLATAGVFVQVGHGAHPDIEEWQARRGRPSREAQAPATRADGATSAPRALAIGSDSTVDYRI